MTNDRLHGKISPEDAFHIVLNALITLDRD
jgi:hypothetical protein